MSIRFVCPKCGKRYKVRDEQAGSKGVCTCGFVIQIPSSPDKGATDLNIKHIPSDSTEICAGCLKTIPPGQARELLDGKIYCVRCADRFAKIKNELQDSGDQADNDIVNFEPDSFIRKSFMARLIGCSIGVIIILLFVLIRHGIIPAAFVGAFGAVGAFIMVKKGHEYDLKITKDKETFAMAQRRVKLKSPKAKFAAVSIIAVFCISISIMMYSTFYDDGSANPIKSLFIEHWKVKLVLLLVNIPIFILIGRLMAGSWQKYWRVARWHWVPIRSGFFIFFKGWWKTMESISMDELIQILSVDAICFWVYLLQCILINLVL